MPRTQKLAFLAYSFVQVSTCQGRRRVPPQKGTLKETQFFGTYQNKPFRGPHSKRGSYRKRPYGATPYKAVTNRFPQVGGNQTTEAPKVDPTLGDEGLEPPPMTP